MTMNLDISPEEQAFRQEVREFAQAHLPESVQRKILYGEKLEKHEYVDWQKHLYRQGWIAPAWPVEYWGSGWSLAKQCIFGHELGLECDPATILFGIALVSSVYYSLGTVVALVVTLPSIFILDC